MANIKIAIINEYAPLADADVQPVVDALQIQIHRDFAPVWGIDADLAYFKMGIPVPDDMWQLIILNNTDQAGTLGYHDLTANGLPLGKVFAGTEIQNKSSWTVTVSHELMEMLGDSSINKTVVKGNADGTSSHYAYENCDACEDDKYGYQINGILVSNFVFPAWFEQFNHPAGTQFDFQKLISEPFQLLPGGYFSINNGNNWNQVYGQHAERTYKMRAHVGSRRERRTVHPHHWMKSENKRRN